MQRPAAIVLAACILSLSPRGSAAQFLREAAVPLQGPNAEWFVPPGWQVAHEARGDLNRDGRADVAMHLVPAARRDEPDSLATAPSSHGLVILLAERGGGFRRAAFTTALLTQSVPRYALALAIRRGVLTVTQGFGAEVVTDVAHRFRFDPARGRFVLIGREHHRRPRSREGASERWSDDYVAGVRRVTTGSWSASGRYRETTRRETISRSTTLLEHMVEQPGG